MLQYEHCATPPHSSLGSTTRSDGAPNVRKNSAVTADQTNFNDGGFVRPGKTVRTQRARTCLEQMTAASLATSTFKSAAGPSRGHVSKTPHAWTTTAKPRIPPQKFHHPITLAMPGEERRLWKSNRTDDNCPSRLQRVLKGVQCSSTCDRRAASLGNVREPAPAAVLTSSYTRNS